MGIIHCDFKPDNILTEKRADTNFKEDDLLEMIKHFYLIDYGLSKKYLNDDGHHIEND
jgi:serine/threonine protein kinase